MDRTVHGRRMSRGGALLRLRGLVMKEFRQVWRDPSSVGIAFILPVILLLIFGYGLSLDLQDVPLAVVVEQPSGATRRLVDRFHGSSYFHVVRAFSMPEAVAMLDRGQVDGIVYLQGNFTHDLFGARTARLQLIVNGVDANTARVTKGYVSGAVERWVEAEARSRGEAVPQPVKVQERVWFNAELRSRNFLVPGLVAIVTTLIGTLLTALVMAREWERGTMEALMATPVRIREILLGKLIPYFTLGIASMALVVAASVWIFDVPLRGSLWVLFGSGVLFLLTALGIGLLVSNVAKNQFVAAQASIIATFLPAFMLSGYIFDIGSMPRAIQLLTRIIPARYFVSILQTQFLAGDVWSVVLPNAAVLAAMAALLLGVVRWRSRKRLD